MKTLTIVPDITDVLPNGNDKCVMCGEDSGVGVTVPIDLRNFYVQGQGQLCFCCAGKTGLVNFPLGIRKEDPWTGQPVKA